MHVSKFIRTSPMRISVVLPCLFTAVGLFSGAGFAEPPTPAGEKASSADENPTAAAAESEADAANEQAASEKAETAPTPKKCEVVVMDLKPRGLPKDQEYVAEILTNSMTAEIAASTGCKVISEQDIRSMMDFEATKAACGGEEDSCMAEIGSALGVDLVIGGVVGQLGSSFTFQATLRDVSKGEVVARFNETVKGDPELLNHAAKNAGRALFQMELLPAVASTRTASTTGGVTSVAGAESEEKGMSFMMLGGFGLAGAGLVTAAVGGGLAVYMDWQLGSFQKGDGNEQQYAPTQTAGIIGLVAAAAGLTVTVLGAGIGALGMME